MRTEKIIGFILFLCVNFTGFSQTEELKYLASMSEERKGSKSKQLEGMQGEVEKVIITSQTSNTLELDIHFTGYSGKNLKVLALGKSGTPKLEIFPYTKKISSGKQKIKARLRLVRPQETNTEFIELVFTNGILRFKGISYVYEFSKNWFPKDVNANDSTNPSTPAVERTPQTIVLTMKPLGNAKEVFFQ